MSEISIFGLVPEPLTFRDADGVPHVMKSRLHFDMVELAQAAELLRGIQAAQATLGMIRADPESAQSQEAIQRAATLVDRTLEAMLHLLVPTVSLEAWRGVPTALKYRVLEQWKAAQPPDLPNPAAVEAAGAPTPPSSPSPASSAPTASTLSAPRSGS